LLGGTGRGSRPRRLRSAASGEVTKAGTTEPLPPPSTVGAPAWLGVRVGVTGGFRVGFGVAIRVGVRDRVRVRVGVRAMVRATSLPTSSSRRGRAAE